MKIIKNNNTVEIEEKKTVRNRIINAQCEHCNSELQVSPEDIFINDCCDSFECPCCGKVSTVYEEREDVTLEDLRFPRDFYRFKPRKFDEMFGATKDTPKMKYIHESIKDGVHFLRSHPDEYFWYTATGDMHILVQKDLDNYECVSGYVITVSHGYYEAWIEEKGIE